MIYLHHFGKYIPKRAGNQDEMIIEDEPLVPDVDLIEDDSQKKKRKLWPFGKKRKNSKNDQTEDSGEEEQ
jgi:hypothetical protein